MRSRRRKDKRRGKREEGLMGGKEEVRRWKRREKGRRGEASRQKGRI